MIRVMLDTNVLIPGMVFAGSQRKLLHTIHLNKASLIVDEFLLKESKAVLSQKFPGHEKLLNNFLLLLQVEHLPLPSKQSVKEARAIIRDPKDAVILASAISAKPDVFVSGNLDFHTSDVKSVVNVLHPKEAIALINYQK